MRKRNDDGGTEFGDSALRAADLAAHLRAGGDLIPCGQPVTPLIAGEVQYAQLELYGARWHGYDQACWEKRTFVAGGPLMLCATALASLAGNSLRKRTALAATQPQWRSLGWMPMAVTSDRLLACHAGAWQSVWFSGIRHAVLESDLSGVQLFFDTEAPYRLHRPHAYYLEVMLTKLIGGHLPDAPLASAA